MKIGVKSAQDFLALLVRRKWWVIAPFVSLSCIVAVLTKELPKLYVSQSLVLVKPRDVPENFVMDLISGTTQQRLRSIQQTVMSRNNIVAILSEFKSRLPEFDALNMDEAVEKMRHQVDVQFDMVPDSRGIMAITSFRILFEHRNPAVAKDIASKLTTLFIEQDSRTRETHVYGTTEFLATEHQKRRQELAASDEKVKILKSAYPFGLPEQYASNQGALDHYNNEKRANLDAINRARTQKHNLEQVMALVPEFIPYQTPTPTRTLTETEQLIEQYRKAKDELADLTERYPPGSKMPEIQVASIRVERLKEKIKIPPEELEAAMKPKPAPEEGRAPTGKTINPVYLNLQNQLRELETESQIRQKDTARIESDIRKYTGRVEKTPEVELKLRDVLRENSDLHAKYEDLDQKLTAARLSESLEQRQRGDQFMVLDAANFPIEPSKPNKWGILFVGFAMCLALSIAMAFIVDVVRQRVWTQSEVEAFWGVPVMVDIPEIITDSDVAVANHRKWVLAGSAAAACAVYAVCLYLVYMRTAYILNQLDPVLQKVVYR